MSTKDLADVEDTNALAYKRDGSQLVAVRQDACINIYDNSVHHDIIEPIRDEHVEPIGSVAISDAYIATASNDGKVLLFSTTDNKFSKLLFRSQVPVRDIAFNSTGNKLAVASDENMIRLVLVNDVTNIVVLEGHVQTVKSLAYDPKDKYLVSTACDGTVIIWLINPSTGAPGMVKSFKGQLPPTLPDIIRNSTVSWNPNGSYIAMPGRNGSIQLIQRDKWSIAHTLVHPRVEEATHVTWSPNGRYLASTGKHKHIYIWDIKTRQIVSQRDITRQVTALVWNPIRNELTYTTSGSDGVLTWEPAVPETLQSPLKQSSRRSTTDTPPIESSMPDFLDDMALTDTLDGDDISLAGTEDDVAEIGEDLDGNLFSDMESVEGQPHQDEMEQQQAPIHHVKGPVSTLEWPMRFQPGSTTFKNMVNPTTPEENERRYLDFNLVGIVYTIYQSSHSIVNVEFHDQSENRNFHFSDYFHYTMAALGSNGLVFGVEGQEKVKERRSRTTNGIEDDDDLSNSDGDEEDTMERTSSMVHYRPLNSWSNQKEWTVHLPLGEDVEAVAINDVSVIAVTSAGYVRIFTISGVQKHIFCIQDVVSIVGKSDLAFFVCSTGPTINKQQQVLEFILLNTSDNDILQRGPMPISTEHELTWIGFSETSQPASYDTKGILRVLHRQRRPGQSAWVPLFDGVQIAARRERNERYWPIGLLHDRLMCIILRGQNTEPYFPVPLSTEVELRVPTAAVDLKYDDLEESYLRKRIVTLHERDEADATDSLEQHEQFIDQAELDMDKALLQLIQLACKTEKLNRALDLTNALHLSRSVDAAIQIASHHRLTTLADKFTEIKEINFMNQHRHRTAHTTALHDFQQSQVSLFPSSTSTMSSDLAFVDRAPSNGYESSMHLGGFLGSNRKRPSPSTNGTLDIDDDLDLDQTQMTTSTTDMDTTMTSPLPKRSR
ncbi:WD40-repeat-containing domain protein [Halteromyces radiatus]|uniref:WD40-repeat-containing domain protein n=1 Tax=Halteromyces radiatus TaxID=101107 RepID=UPI00221E5682|nr:WD40-repeat-containing domain protein [Halteromyces radiatus]KAI8097208.1 WD40-repeat-containing domain protein [Halteromyces radiatus]